MPLRLIRAVLRPGRWRALAIALVTLAVGSAILTPHLNPLTRPLVDLDVDSALAFGWSALNQTRTDIVAHVQIEGDWPRDLNALDAPVRNGVLDIVSPEPYLLRARLADSAALPAALRGTEVLYRLDPASLQWQCGGGVPPIPDRYLPLNCRGDAAVGRGGGFGLLLLTVAACLGLAWLYLLQHPLLLPILRRPLALLARPVDSLVRIDRLLGWLHRRDAVLQAAGIAGEDWREALQWHTLPPAIRVERLALRIGARCEAVADSPLPGLLPEWQLPRDLPVGLERCRCYVPASEVTGSEVVRQLRADTRGHELMLVLPSPEQQSDVQGFCADPSNAFVCIDAEAVTAWLLSRRPVDVFVRLLAEQLRVTRISPYQTRGGLVRPALFFGRERLLARIVGREPENYLLVGGRQLGKSSLMKAIERSLHAHPRVQCHYLTLRDHRLMPRLALYAGLPPEMTLDAVIDQLIARAGGRRLLLLIDESDLLVRDEAARGYPQLAALRALSEEGRCHFILAGFWDLYAATTLDYQSPLRNFGEVIVLGALEREACRELATVPLARLGLRYSSDDLVERIVEASGQRANLVALLCQECLEALPAGRRLIDSGLLAQAERAASVQDALSGWARLIQDDHAARIDRIVVYWLGLHGSARLADLVAAFDGRTLDIETLRLSLARLRLAYVIAQDGDSYRFAVPLFARLLQGEDIALLLEQEVGTLRR